jgi:uncharacterized protein (TIGR03435 family)
MRENAGQRRQANYLRAVWFDRSKRVDGRDADFPTGSVGTWSQSDGLPVIDQTGLTAKFDFELKLQLTPQVGQANDDTAPETLFTALRAAGTELN